MMKFKNNNEYLNQISSNTLLKISDDLDPQNLNQFFNQFSKDHRKKRLFIAHATMVKHIQCTHPPQTCKRCHLERQVLTSKDTFLKEAELEIVKQQIDPKITANFKKQFNDLVFSSDIFDLDKMKDSLHSFLYSLCFVKAVNTINIVMMKYPTILTYLSDQEFNSICVAAARNHLYDFVAYLCKDGRSVDEYTLMPDANVINGIITPFIGACLRIVEPGFDAKRLQNGVRVIELLLENKIDPHKKYIIDDYSDEEIVKAIEKGEGYSVVEACVDTLNKWKEFSEEEKKKYGNINIQAIQALVELLSKIIPSEDQQQALSTGLIR